MVDTSTSTPAKGMRSLAVLFAMWYAFNAYYNVSNKMVVRTWFVPYTCAALQVISRVFENPLVFSCFGSNVLCIYTQVTKKMQNRL